MKQILERAVSTASVTLALALLAGLAACGGGGADEASTSRLLAVDSNGASPVEGRVGTLAAVGSTAAAAIGTLQLASSNASGRARGGSVCATSADGNLVLFSSDASNLVAGDTNSATDVFLKNLRSGAVVRVNTSTAGTQLFGGSACLGMTPSGQHVVFSAQVVMPTPNLIFAQPTETALLVKNIATGVTQRVTPALSAFANTEKYIYSGVSDDGSRVAFVAAPTRTYLGGYLSVANGSARLLVAEVGTGVVVNHESQVHIDLSGDAQVDSDATLLPDGRRLAFTARADHPEIGDVNQRRDLFVLDLATRNLQRVPGDMAGPLLGTVPAGDRVAVSTSVNGVFGVYLQSLANGTLSFAMPLTGLEYFDRFSAVSGDGSKLAFVRRVGRDNQAFVRTVASGAEQRLAVRTNGVVSNGYEIAALVSRDASAAAFQSISSNLASGLLSYRIESFVKTVGLSAAAQ